MVPLHEIVHSSSRTTAWREWMDYAQGEGYRLHPYQQQMMDRFDLRYGREVRHLTDEMYRFDRVGRAAGIFRDLMDRAIRLQGMRGVALTITRDEWRLLMIEMSPYEIQRNFGPEGAAPSFRGIRLVIV